MVWGKCTTSAECKTIRIAVSTVMDDRLDLRDSQEMFCFKQKGVLERSFQKGDTGSVGTRGVRKKGTWEVCLNVLSRGD